MTFKETLKLAGMTFLVTIAGTVIYTYVHMLIFQVEFSLGSVFFGQLILMALFCGLSIFVFYSRKEITDEAMRNRLIIHFILMYIIIVGLCLYWRWILPKASHIFFVSITIFLSYFAIWIIIFIENRNTADRLNNIIALRKKKQK